MHKTAVLVLTLAVAGSCWALAAEPQLYAKRDCNAVISSASAFHECYDDNLAAANAALNALYQQLLSQRVFYVGSRERLRDVERSWIVYKDRECDYEYGPLTVHSNEDHWLARADCEIRVTEARIRELQGRPSCTGGDSLCTPHMR